MKREKPHTCTTSARQLMQHPAALAYIPGWLHITSIYLRDCKICTFQGEIRSSKAKADTQLRAETLGITRDSRERIRPARHVQYFGSG
jgi:hypothetical protein